jgi:hypothetical protein
MRIDSVSHVTEPIGLEHFLEAAADFDPYDPKSIWNMREPLAALALNREWIFSAVADSLRTRLRSPWAREQPSYFLLHTCATFGLRANIWLPERQGSHNLLENAAFSYDFPHDHNFDILTVTCFGVGYETEIYSYEELPADIAVGDVIDVIPLGRRRISPGTVFLYEACRDVHTQLPVDEITITLNFLPLRTQDHARSQLIFEVLDDEHLRVMGVPLSPEGREMSAIRMLMKLASVGRWEASELGGVARLHDKPRVRDYAREALARLDTAPEDIHSSLVREIDRDNIAFKYHEVAQISRARRVA